MRNLLAALLLVLFGAFPACAKVVVFWQEGFPVAASQPASRDALTKALDGANAVFAGIDGLKNPATLAGADLLVLPYGSAVPVDAWSAMIGYLRSGGNLLVLGGQPFRVPVTASGGRFIQAPPQDTYSRELGIEHTYEAPPAEHARFTWRTEYSFLPHVSIQARRFFVLEGRCDGLGFMANPEGLYTASPVVVFDRMGPAEQGGTGAGSRAVLLDFEPLPGYWESADGISLVHQAAAYAQQGPATFTLEMPFSTLKPGEVPRVAIHLRNSLLERERQPLAGEVRAELVSGTTVLETLRAPCSGARMDAELAFRKAYPPGFYLVRGVWEGGAQGREAYQNGFWVEDAKLLTTGPALGVKGDFLTRDSQPFFPFGANYFSTEDNGWDFAGPRNAWIWERDFDEMQRDGVTFVRTGVWKPAPRIVDPATKGVTERFLRNLEAYLLSASRHHMIVNFVFYSFTPAPLDPAAPPRTSAAPAGGASQPPQPNVYLDPASVKSELNYVLSIVRRFKDVPFVGWDLINEPSFANPGRLWAGNTPNGDPVELDLWRQWLARTYGDIGALRDAWRVAPDQLASFGDAPIPTIDNLTFDRYRNPGMVRAFDFNLFSQDMFAGWVQSMVSAIRGAGSRQLIDVGQDEGGVTDRVLNQFYASAGVAFTTNHTYWRDDALLWDSVAAKRPGMPNIVGETGYQPVRSADGTWRYDELTGAALDERKWAMGFAATSGSIVWDWGRDLDFGVKRSDGSAKILQTMMRGMGEFAEKAAPYATGLIPPPVALVLPQSYQLSTDNTAAVEAQQKAVRALYYYARGEAYAVGEYQIDLLGDPQLIVLPSPEGLAPAAWDAIRAKVSAGATLLVTGPFDGDAHMHATGRQRDAGLSYETVPLQERGELLKFPGGEERLSFGGDKTTYLNRAVLANKNSWAEVALGKGKILFSPLPLELNDNLQAIGDVYRYAMRAAGVFSAYATTLPDPGILICPTEFPNATLYVLSSESGQQAVSFTDRRSGKLFAGALEPGRSALLLVSTSGAVLASYNWPAR